MRVVLIPLLFGVLLLFSNCESGQPKVVVSKTIENTPKRSHSAEMLLNEYLSEIDPDRTLDSTSRKFNFSELNVDYDLIQPLFQANCYSCHKPNGGAPFSLTNFQAIKKRALAISDVLKMEIMPPWSADNSYSQFLNAPPINDSTRALILEWIDKKCVGGNDLNASPIQLEMADPISFKSKEYEIESNEDAYYYTRFDAQLTEGLKMCYVDYTESNPRIVHHRTLFIDTSGLILNKDLTQKEYNEILDKLAIFSVWSKGMIPYALTDDFFFEVPKNAKFLLQSHYEGDGNIGQKDNFSLNLYPSKSSKNRIHLTAINKFDILYLANEISTETISYSVEDTITITGLVPHMHYLCKKVECYAMSNGEKIQLLKIPNWNYYFQGQYTLEKPIVIPAGSTVYMDVVIDNTANNPVQPNDPVRDVRYAQGSKDEMLVLTLLHVNGKIDTGLKIAQKIFK